jgi:ribose transport system substrate-binding protein
MFRTGWLVLLTVAAALAVAGCGEDDSSSSAAGGDTVGVDVGEGQTVEVPKGEPNVALFFFNNNAYQNAYVSAAMKEAKRAGVDLELIDSGGDPSKQYNQLQTTLQGGKYNAWIVVPIDGKLTCNILSKDAPEEGVVVQVSLLSVCNRDLKSADEAGQWQAGTLGTEGAENLVAYKVAWLEEVQKRLAGVDQIGLIGGPELEGNWQGLMKALEQYPEIKDKIVAEAHTDFTTPTALAEAQTMLRAKPDIDLVLSVYSDITRGVIQALDSEGKLGDVKVIDIGASSYSVDQIKEGNLEFTIPYNPIGNGRVAVQQIVNAFEGKPVERFIDDFAVSELGTMNDPLIIDKSNTDSFKPQY